MNRTVWCVLGILGSGLLGLARPADADDLKVGDKAPAFSLMGTDGKTYSLDQFKGKKAVVVAWFPKADHPRLHSRVQVVPREQRQLSSH